MRSNSCKTEKRRKREKTHAKENQRWDGVVQVSILPFDYDKYIPCFFLENNIFLAVHRSSSHFFLSNRQIHEESRYVESCMHSVLEDGMCLIHGNYVSLMLFLPAIMKLCYQHVFIKSYVVYYSY